MEAIRRIFQLPELRAKILFTLAMLVVCRIGGFVPVPGINGELAVGFFRSQTGGGQNLFQLFDIFAGGAFSNMTVIALGVMPYISAQIIVQLLTAVFPSLQREMRENPEQGRRKMTKMTRVGTVALAFIQSSLFARFALGMNLTRPGIIGPELLELQAFGIPWFFYLTFIATMTTGTVVLMWIGEQISERGIGNGMSLIITLGIVSQLPTAIGLVFQQLNLDSQLPGQMNFASVLSLIVVFICVVWGTVMVIQGHRRIPLQYARRVVGRKEAQGGNSYIPLKINYAGVIPVIFASALLMFPATIGQFVGAGNWVGTVANWFSPGSTAHLVMFVVLIIGFTYFWTATQFRPDQIASDMKKNGAFIPGIRQGKPTQDYLETTMNRITLFGAVSLAIIAILPNIVGRIMGVPATISYFFGGTSLLIMVGVVLDTLKQIESHLLMKRYEGFMKKGRVRGR